MMHISLFLLCRNLCPEGVKGRGLSVHKTFPATTEVAQTAILPPVVQMKENLSCLQFPSRKGGSHPQGQRCNGQPGIRVTAGGNRRAVTDVQIR